MVRKGRLTGSSIRVEHDFSPVRRQPADPCLQMRLSLNIVFAGDQKTASSRTSFCHVTVSVFTVSNFSRENNPEMLSDAVQSEIKRFQ